MNGVKQQDFMDGIALVGLVAVAGVIVVSTWGFIVVVSYAAGKLGLL